MATDNQISITGNLGADPELRFTATGSAVATLNVGVSERRFNRETGKWDDGDSSWFRVTVWNQLAENVAATLTRGQRVMVTGMMKQRSYTDKEGDTHYIWEIKADEIGVSLKFATAEIKRATRARPATPDETDPWTTATPERPATPDETDPWTTASEPRAASTRAPRSKRAGRGPGTEVPAAT